MARKPRGYFKASPWELEDAEEEQVEIVVNHAPKRFVIEKGKLNGMEFERSSRAKRAGKLVQTPLDTVFLPADDVILAIGQENAFPWIERDIGIEFDKWDMPEGRQDDLPVDAPGRLLRRRRGLGPEEHHLGGRARRTRRRSRIHNHCQGIAAHRAPAAGDEPRRRTKMGLHEWSYSNDYNPANAPEDEARRSRRALQEASTSRSRLGFTAEQTAREVERCLNCDMQTVFTDTLCIECDACVDVCPVAVPDDRARTARSRSCASA